MSPRSDPPVGAVTYAHHPPLKDWLSTVSAGLFGQNLPALRIPSFLMGAATLAFMASLLRACRLRWGPVLLAVGAMASTGFFYVYGRLGVSFSLLLASAAAVGMAAPDRQPAALGAAGIGLVAALCALQSWIGLAALGPLMLWLFADRFRRGDIAPKAQPEPARTRLGAYLARGWSPALTALVVGTAAGVTVTAAWMLNATGVRGVGRPGRGEGQQRGRLERPGARLHIRRVPVQTVGLRHRGDAGARMAAGPARARVLSGLIDRRTRVPAAITLAVAAAMTFGLQQGAWIHRLWNFPWLMPVTIGLGSLLDAVRRLAPSRWRLGAALVAAAVIAATVVAVAAGSTRDRYITDPAHLGEALEQVAEMPEGRRAELAWTGPGLPAPRWASYYLDIPVWDLKESRLDRAGRLRPGDREGQPDTGVPSRRGPVGPAGLGGRLPGDHGRVADEMRAEPLR